MSLVVVEPPDPILTPSDIQAAYGIAGGDDYLMRQIAAAQALIDGPAGSIGRAIGEQTLELRIDRFPAWSCGADFVLPHDLGRRFHQRSPHGYDIALPCPPVTSILSVSYVDALGVTQTLDPSSYRLVGQDDDPRLCLAFGATWPAIRFGEEVIAIRYVAGYEAVPEPLREWVAVKVREKWFGRDRDPTIRSQEVPGVLSTAYQIGVFGAAIDGTDDLLAPFRVVSL